MRTTITQVDAFTDAPFTGNPAAVCLLKEPMSDQWMQKVAMEMNLSETAFLVRIDDGFHLRWFTPTIEVELCGHATLAGAHVLWETGVLKAGETARFHTKSGLLSARRKDDWIEMNLPSMPPSDADAPDGLREALGVPFHYVGMNQFDYLVETDSEERVRCMRPDFTLLGSILTGGVVVTSRAMMAGFDFVSRYFAPAFGINEDPVTGTAHCCLGPYWQARLKKNDFVAAQLSKRGGTVRVKVEDDRVVLAGHAVTVMRCEMFH